MDREVVEYVAEYDIVRFISSKKGRFKKLKYNGCYISINCGSLRHQNTFDFLRALNNSARDAFEGFLSSQEAKSAAAIMFFMSSMVPNFFCLKANCCSEHVIDPMLTTPTDFKSLSGFKLCVRWRFEIRRIHLVLLVVLNFVDRSIVAKFLF